MISNLKNLKKKTLNLVKNGRHIECIENFLNFDRRIVISDLENRLIRIFVQFDEKNLEFT